MNEEMILPVPAEETADMHTEPAEVGAPFGDELATEASLEKPAFSVPNADQPDTSEQTDEMLTQQLHTRLANEFRDLCREVPHTFATFDTVPDAVVTMAVEQDISLFDAYLRHSFYENRRMDEAAKAQRSAAEKSTGSLAAPPDHPHPEVDAFVSALRQSLR